MPLMITSVHLSIYNNIHNVYKYELFLHWSTYTYIKLSLLLPSESADDLTNGVRLGVGWWCMRATEVTWWHELPVDWDIVKPST